MRVKSEQKKFMKRAIKLASKGVGKVSPQPLAGAVIVKDGRIIGEGWHPEYAGIHAERYAIADCLERGENPVGAEMYCTLEPCCHYGKNPPCTEAIIEAGISRVYVGSVDPNPKAAGKGLSILRDHGIEVVEHILEKECNEQNAAFFHYINTGRPLTYLQYVISLDGKTASAEGHFRKQLGKTALNRIAKMRNQCDAVITGIGTIRAVDPVLDCTLRGGRNPIRVVCDSKLNTPLNSKVVLTAKETPLIIATCQKDEKKLAPYKAAGAEIMQVKETNGHVDLHEVFEKLGEKRIISVLMEAGSEMSGTALTNGLINRILTYVTPQIVGTAGVKSPIAGFLFNSEDGMVRVTDLQTTKLGKDLLIEGKII